MNLFNDPRSATFLVAGGNQALVYSPTYAGRIALDDFAGDKVNIADKQLALVVDAATDITREKNFLITGDTYPALKTVRFIQGTPKSANVSSVTGHGFGDKAYVQSNPIDLSKEIHIVSHIAKQSYSSAWVVGDLAANSGAITPATNITYKFKIAFGGRQQQKQYSQAGTNRMYVNIKQLSTVVTNARDRFIKRLTTGLNKLSSHEGRKRANGYQAGNKPAIVFAINIAGGAGTSITTILAAAVGTTFIYEQDGSKIYRFTVTEDFKETLRKVVANITNITNATTIEVIDLATAGSVAMAAGAAACDAMLIVALDSKAAEVDDRLETHKTTIAQIGLEGFDSTVRRVVGSRTYRGFGYGWQLYVEYLKRAQMEVNGIETMPGENRPMPGYPVYLAKDETLYDVHEIWHQDLSFPGFSRQDNRSQIVVLVPAADAATTTSLNAALRTLIQSCPNVAYHGSDAVSPNIFA